MMQTGFGRAFSSTSTTDAWKIYAEVLRPVDRLKPSEFSLRHRHLSENESPEHPGAWTFEPFPFLEPIMDAVEEAIRTGKQGFCMMKAAQGGGSESMIGVWAWLQAGYPGPIGYMISKDSIAKEFGRVRFSHAIDTMEPLSRKALRGRKGGESLLQKRFADGSLSLFGGRSVLNLQSLPYRFFFIDEVDSLLDEIQGAGDPIELAKRRMDAFSGETLLLAFAHPSTRARGAAKLYYEFSDQRRGFVACIHCAGEFWLQWEHVRATAQDGLTQAQAELRSDCYAYYCPACGVQITDAERALMVRKVRYRSLLSPEDAASKTYIGVHFSQLYYPHKTIRELAAAWAESIGSEPKRRVFFNKILGEPFEITVQETSAEDWRRCIVVPRALPAGEEDLETWRLGQVPAGVRFLTAGQDSRTTALHWAVWGWGQLKTAEGQGAPCAWLIDYGVGERPYSQVLDSSELRLCDQVLYGRGFASNAAAGQQFFRVLKGGHDSGWQPEAVYKYCQMHAGRAIPIKGGSHNEDEDFESTAPHYKWSAPRKHGVRGELVSEPWNHPLLLNTYQLKIDFFAMAARRIALEGRPDRIPCVRLPVDCQEDFIAHLASERLLKVRRRGRDVQVWKKVHRENHWLDCTIYAYGLALDLGLIQPMLPFEAPSAPKQQYAPRKPDAKGAGWKIGR